MKKKFSLPARAPDDGCSLRPASQGGVSRRFMVGSAIGLVMPSAHSPWTKPVVAGAIRWDAWAATGSPVQAAVQATLGPKEYQFRAPFCAKPSSPNLIDYGACNTQVSMDREIVYAEMCGLKYWAYCWYDADDPLMNAWKLHQSSKLRRRIAWCMILQFSRMTGPADFSRNLDKYIEYFKSGNYQFAGKGAPLIYLLFDDPSGLTRNWGGDWNKLKLAFDTLRSRTKMAGLADPYIVIMGGKPKFANDVRSRIGAQAISNYMAPVPAGEPATFKDENQSAETYWNEMASQGCEVVPICQTGWDTRPRRVHPPFWTAKIKQTRPLSQYLQPGSTSEVVDQLKRARTFIEVNPISCLNSIMLIYSWNECDEGGNVLMPTLQNDPKGLGSEFAAHQISQAVG